VQIDGLMHNAIAPWGDLSWSTSFPGGCKAASWNAYHPAGSRHPAVHAGALVEILDGGAVIWAGVLKEPNWRTGEFHAIGIGPMAEAFICLDALGDATSRPDVATDRAMDRGWLALGRDGSVPTTAYTTATEGVNTLAALFDSNSDELSQWWTVRADRILRFESDPDLYWETRPGAVDLGNTVESFASTIHVRYRISGGYDTETVTDAAAELRFGAKEEGVDATSLGVISAARAADIGQGILDKGRSRLGWTNPIEVSSNDLTNLYGQPADVSMVEAGHSLTVHGVFDDIQFLDGQTSLDLIIGETNYVDGSDVVTLSPLDMAASDFTKVIEDVFTAIGGAA
jgi:hypothetical protein